MNGNQAAFPTLKVEDAVRAVNRAVLATRMRFVLPVILAIGVMGCSSSERGNIIDLRETASPDGRYVCAVFGEIFYNTTGYPQHVDLRRAGDKRGYPGNVCVVPVGDDVAVSWASPTNFLVTLSLEARRSVPAATNLIGVSVTYSRMTR